MFGRRGPLRVPSQPPPRAADEKFQIELQVEYNMPEGLDTVVALNATIRRTVGVRPNSAKTPDSYTRRHPRRSATGRASCSGKL